jgi:hypothetical protein
MTYLRSYVTGSNDATLNAVGRTMAVSLVGVHQHTALEHLLVVPLGKVSLGVWISTTSRDWWLSAHKGQWCLTTAASNAAAL